MVADSRFPKHRHIGASGVALASWRRWQRAWRNTKPHAPAQRLRNGRESDRTRPEGLIRGGGEPGEYSRGEATPVRTSDETTALWDSGRTLHVMATAVAVSCVTLPADASAWSIATSPIKSDRPRVENGGVNGRTMNSTSTAALHFEIIARRTVAIDGRMFMCDFKDPYKSNATVADRTA